MKYFMTVSTDHRRVWANPKLMFRLQTDWLAYHRKGVRKVMTLMFQELGLGPSMLDEVQIVCYGPADTPQQHVWSDSVATFSRLCPNGALAAWVQLARGVGVDYKAAHAVIVFFLGWNFSSEKGDTTEDAAGVVLVVTGC